MKPLSKNLYILLFISTFTAIFFIALSYSFLESYYGEDVSILILSIIGFFLLISHFAVVLHLTYKMWFSIQDMYARTTPGKAIGLLFLPFFNIYWLYQVLVGFVDDYNNFINRNQIETPKLQRGAFVAYYVFYIAGTILSPIPLISLLFILIYLIFGSIIISMVCDAVNAVSLGLSKRITEMESAKRTF